MADRGEDATDRTLPLAGKVLLVIGGTAGIGASAANALAEAGSVVVATSHDVQSIATARGRLDAGIEVEHVDARDAAATDGLVAAITARHGRLDGLCHIAGGSGRRFGDGPLHELTDEGWHETFRLNAESVLISNRAAVRQFLRQGDGGAIVNLGSVLASAPAPAFFATHAYAAAKAAIEGFTRSVAAYYAPHDIRANMLVCGLVDTPMAARALNDAAIMGFVKSKQPLDSGRAGLPADFDAAVVFLFSRGSRFMTGQSIVIDGGWSCTDGQLGGQPPTAAFFSERIGTP